MSVQPEGRLARIEFAEAHVGPWGSAATSIGLTSAQVTTMGTKTTAARNAYNAKVAAVNAARAATLEYHNAVADLGGYVSGLLKDVKAAAALDPNVYALAEIPAPAAPAPVPAPGMPTDFRTTLLPGGALEIKFKCANPRNGGVLYHVERRVGSTGAFTFLGATGQKKWTDLTVPANSGPVTYRITAARSTGAGVPNEFTVNFGVGSGGEVTASVVQATPRIAA